MWALRRSLARSVSVPSSNVNVNASVRGYRGVGVGVLFTSRVPLSLSASNVLSSNTTTINNNNKLNNKAPSRAFTQSAVSAQEASEASADDVQDKVAEARKAKKARSEGGVQAAMSERAANARKARSGGGGGDANSQTKTKTKANASTKTKTTKANSPAAATDAKTQAKLELRAKAAEARKAKREALQAQIRAKRKETAMKVKEMRRQRAAKANERARLRRERVAERNKMLSKKNLRAPLKRPTSAFQNFVSLGVKAAYAEADANNKPSINDVFVQQTNKWNALSKEEQEKYKDKDYDIKIKEYSEKYKEWKASLSRAQLKAKRQKRRNSPSISSYSLYVKENYGTHTGGEGDRTKVFGDINSQLAREYNALSDAEKQAYRDRAARMRLEANRAREEEKAAKEKEAASA